MADARGEWVLRVYSVAVVAFARNEQIVQIPLPSHRKICELDIESTSNYLRYDDNIIITIEDYIVATNGWSPTILTTRGLAVENGHYQYKWANLVGQSYGLKDTTYCMQDTDCRIPRSENSGPFNLKVKEEFLEKITAVDISSLATLDFMVIVAGNYQSSDCRHSGITLNVKMKYMP